MGWGVLFVLVEDDVGFTKLGDIVVVLKGRIDG